MSFNFPGAAPNDQGSWIQHFQPQDLDPHRSQVPHAGQFVNAAMAHSSTKPAVALHAPQHAIQKQQVCGGPQLQHTTREAEMAVRRSSLTNTWAIEDYDLLMPTPIMENFTACATAEVNTSNEAAAKPTFSQIPQEQNDYSSSLTTHEMEQQLDFLRRQQIVMTEQLQMMIVQSPPGMPDGSGSAAANAVISASTVAQQPPTLASQPTATLNSPRLVSMSSALLSPQQMSNTYTTLKKNKDPLKPKRPLTAYNIYFREQRARMLDALPGQQVCSSSNYESSVSRVSAPDTGQLGDQTPTVGNRKRKRKPHGVGFQKMAKIIGAKWQELDEAGRAKYKRMAHDDSLRYRKAMEEYARRKYPGENG